MQAAQRAGKKTASCSITGPHMEISCWRSMRGRAGEQERKTRDFRTKRAEITSNSVGVNCDKLSLALLPQHMLCYPADEIKNVWNMPPAVSLHSGPRSLLVTGEQSLLFCCAGA